MESIVPNCPAGLCITRQDFLKPDFSVDNFFIEQSVRDTPLDILRDDLGIYLKVLRSSMIELINEDYADFVNLSTNLVGLDKCILRLKEPLLKHQEEVEKANAGIEATLSQVRQKLDVQARIREKKSSLATLQHICEALGKVERMLATERDRNINNKDGGGIAPDVAERIAADINHLLFSVWKMKESSLIQDLEPRIAAICDALNSSLDDSLLAALKERKVDLISQCCRIYAITDRIPQAEYLVRETIIRPVVAEILTESQLENEPLGLKGLYSRLLMLIPEYLAELIHITTDSRNVQEKSVKGFDFLVNSFWPVVAESLRDSLSLIFWPGNPVEFWRHYTTSVQFLVDLERNLTTEESLLRLRAHPAYTAFLQAWNIPVYFQIRFQEIAGPFELSLGGLVEKAEYPESGFQLRASEQALAAVRRCFDQEIFLLPLTDRFFKLALQIVSRYKTWGMGCLGQFENSQNESSLRLKKSTTSRDLTAQPAGSLANRRSVSDQNLADQHQDSTEEVLLLTLNDLVMIYSDTVKLGDLLPEHLISSISAVLGSCEEKLENCIAVSVSSLQDLLPPIQHKIIAVAAAEPLRLLKQVSDIPRMYRRTNRETPSKPCPYVLSIVEKLVEFRECQQASCKPEVLSTWTAAILEVILSTYLVQVSDVLSSVSKMEESLRKLKKVRERGGVGAGGGKGRGGLSDDDKIRLQLYVDVMHFAREVKEWGSSDKSSEWMRNIQTVVSTAVEGFAPPEPEALQLTA